MEVVILADDAAIAALVADAVESLVRRPGGAVLGLATGSSPLPVYRELVRRHREEGLSFAACRAFLLDEYVGLPAGHPQAYRTFVDEHLAGLVDLPASAVHGPRGDAPDPLAEADRYESAITAAGGIDLQLLGIGTDGHIGFNEPVSSLASRTRLKTLTEQTRRDNARFFGSLDSGSLDSGSLDDVPLHVLTQGVGTILDARHLVLVATGAAKARAVAAAVEGPLCARVPASALQLHPHATVVVDEAAASDLELADYYRQVWAAKPASQPL